MNVIIENIEEKMSSLLVLIQDADVFEKLDSRINSSNIFEILNISRTEIRHSNMLAWLLNPNENHGLSTKFLYGIIVELSKVINADSDLFFKLLVSNLSCAKVYREWKHIDLLIVFPEIEICIVVENKIGAHEHNSHGTDVSQLFTYKKIMQHEYPSYKCLYVYLSPDGEIPSDADWFPFTYSDVLFVLKKVRAENEECLSNVSKVLIDNYIEIINREIIVDDELVRLCNDIYVKHRKALDLIFENKYDEVSIVAEQCRKWISQGEKCGLKETDNSKSKTYVKFTYNPLTKLFKSTAYYCEFEIRSNRDCLYINANLVFILDNASQEERILFKTFNPKTKKKLGNIRGLSGVSKTIVSPDGELDIVFDKIFKALVKKIHQKFQVLKNVQETK